MPYRPLKINICIFYLNKDNRLHSGSEARQVVESNLILITCPLDNSNDSNNLVFLPSHLFLYSSSVWQVLVSFCKRSIKHSF